MGGFAALKYSISILKEVLMADVLVRTRVVFGLLPSETSSKSSNRVEESHC